MKTTYYDVPPIVQGFDFTLEITFPQEVWDDLELATGLLRIDFRKYPDMDNPVLASLSTADTSIVRDVPNKKITLTIANTATVLFLCDKVMFDIARVGTDGSKIAIPGQWTWTVDQRVTRDV